MDDGFRPLMTVPRVTRVSGGLAASSYPLVLIYLTIHAGFRAGGNMADTAGSILGAMLFLVAAPTTWIFAIPFVDASRLTTLAAGALSSLPAWYAVGARLAERQRLWTTWGRRYLTFIVLWTGANLLFLGLLGQLVG